MSISPPNFEGQTYGSYTVGPQIAAHDRIQWHLGTALQSEQSYWLGFPSDDAVPCPEGFTKLNESGLDPEMWVRLVPPGCAISETLMAGPLCPNARTCVGTVRQRYHFQHPLMIFGGRKTRESHLYWCHSILQTKHALSSSPW